MELYLVRWQDDRVSLVSASDQKDLFRCVDSMGDSALCTFKKFDQPVHLVFKPEHSSCEKSVLETAKEWQVADTAGEVIEAMASLFNSGMMSDVTLLVGEAAIQCHKVILCQRCEFFRAMFASGMKEAQSETLTLDSYPYIVMLEIVRFIYTGTFQMPSDEVLSPVYLKAAGGASNSESGLGKYDLQRDFLTELVLAADFFSLPSLTKLSGQKLSEFCVDLEGALNLFNLWTQLKMKEFLHTAAVLARSVLHWTHWTPIPKHDLPSQLSDIIRQINKQDKNASRSSSWTEEKFLNLFLYRTCRDVQLVESIDKLVEEGLVLREINALNLICNSWSRDLPEEIEKVWLSVVDKCLAAGCSVNNQDALRGSPLHSAATCFSVPLVEKLLDAGADPLARNYKGNTPLMEAQEALDVEAGMYCLMEDNSSMTQELLQENAESCSRICDLLTLTSNTRSEHLTERCVEYEENIASEISLNPDFLELFHYESELVRNIRFELCSEDEDFHDTLFEFAFPRATRILDRSETQIIEDISSHEKTFMDCLKRDIYLAEIGRGRGRRLVKYKKEKSTDCDSA